MKKIKEQFFLLEHIPKAPPYIFCLADTRLMAPYFKEVHGLEYHPGPHLNIFEDGNFLYYYNFSSLQKCAQGIFDKLISRPEWGIELDDLILKKSRDFFDYSKQIREKDLNNLDEVELNKITKEWFYTYFRQSWLAGWPAVLIDFDRNLFSNYLLDYLKQKTKQKKYTESVGDIFSILTTPTDDTYAEKESLSLLELLSVVQKNTLLIEALLDEQLGDEEKLQKWSELDKVSWTKFEKHYHNYCWLAFMYIGPAWGQSYFLHSLIGLLKQEVDPMVEIAKNKKKKQALKELQDKYLTELEIHPNHITLFTVARRFVFSKSFRKDAMYFSCFVINQVLKQVAKKKNLSLKQVLNFYPWELEQLLSDQEVEIDRINARIKYGVIYTEEDLMIEKVGQEAKDFVSKIDFKKDEIEQTGNILGDCAMVGKVRGLIKLINSPADMEKMQSGNILLSYATSPDIMPAIKKAAAIITDLGGIICHAAIVSRELRIPCVVGCKKATQILKDGDLVEVDATHGIIRIIK